MKMDKKKTVMIVMPDPGAKRSEFKKLERGKFYQRVVAGSNVVVLDPKVAKAFPSSAIVNQTLNDLLELARKSSRMKPRPRRIKSDVS